MDPDAGLFYTYDGKRLTRARVAGFALELAFQSVHVLGQFALTLWMFGVVDCCMIGLLELWIV